MYKKILLFRISFRLKVLEMAMTKSMRSNRVHKRHHKFHNMFILQSFHRISVRGWSSVLCKYHGSFVYFSPNSAHESCFLSNHRSSPHCCHLFFSWPGQLELLHSFIHTVKQISCLMQRELLRLATFLPPHKFCSTSSDD